MLLFEKLFAQNYADMLVRFGSIIETCNKINGYWESDGWTEIYEDMADKSDRMNEIVDQIVPVLYILSISLSHQEHDSGCVGC